MVPSSYWYSLVAFAALGLGTRLVRRRPLARRLARPLGRRDLVLAVAALVVLGFHCGAMFFADTVAAIPGTDGMASAVDDLGVVSELVYALAAAALVVALRRVWTPALVALGAALAAVGVTMYRWFGLNVHLTAMAFAIVLVVLIASAVVGSPAAPRGPARLGRRVTPAPTG